MAYTLQQLSDFEDIRTLKHRYLHAIDTADIDTLRTLFVEDARIDFRGGLYRLALEGREEILKFFVNGFHSGMIAAHNGHAPIITLTGDNEATGKWYMSDIVYQLETDRSCLSGAAFYQDTYRREGDQWKIATSEYDRLFESVAPINPQMMFSAHYLATHGRKPEEREDTSHQMVWREMPEA
ncbi:nuclear transport factor 2 family protein [Sphingobium sp. Cam5-1]|uniref:nuclear transport factor 2 family protein n=1 Tax=Sphingobium sp. Cam5-1 TaxID=2789327 RepID=UPI0018AD1126|nr:nuclear transport factor 2 family protein [Sphingobium sp. Cam5-1]QPI75029.1 nuclear transport factor 2 family protein [Sphingobium sp. Cam5-1]